MNNRNLRTLLVIATTLSSLPVFAQSQTAGEQSPLEKQFENPPNSARPRVWWHWMNGNVTIDGIEKDLDWMERIGIGGMQNFDANLMTPQVVKNRLIYMTPEWNKAFRRTAELADKKGLELAIAASPGWSETGGPWVPPADGIKKLVWSEQIVTGGKRFTGKIAPSPDVTGTYQNIPFKDELASLSANKEAAPPKASGMIAVIAVPVSAAPLPQPLATDFAGKQLDVTKLSDSDQMSSVKVARGTKEAPGGIMLTYPTAVTIRSATVAAPGLKSTFGPTLYSPIIEVEEASGWRKLADIVVSTVPATVSFPATTGRRFRLTFLPNKDKQPAGLSAGAPGAEGFDLFAIAAQMAGKESEIGDFRLSAEPRIHAAGIKAGFDVALDYYKIADTSGATGFAPGKAIDLTSKLKPDGSIDWTPPKGSDWRIYRFGWSLNGKTNHPASPEATGLEVDKFDAGAVRRYLEHYLGMYKNAVGADLVGKKGVRALLTDSIEVGSANWTPSLPAEFKARRGYDLLPWLPALAGEVVGNAADTDKFLYDYRKTLAELLADAHYGTVAKVARENNLTLYGEALEDRRPMIGDDMQMRKYADIPMAALWTWNRGDPYRITLVGDMKGASSVAHLYGQNLTAAESMTSAAAPWAFAPKDLKRIIDFEFANGINRPVIHTSVHQPLDDKVPGFSLFIFGQYFNRHDTWAEMAKPWVDYISRNSYMLQQGRNYADIAWFYGEEAPLTALFATEKPAGLPTKYAYDFVNADVLANVLTPEGGELVAKSGARYKALHLGGSSHKMTLGTLKRIAAFADAGVLIAGQKPSGSPSLQDNAAEFAALADAVWSKPNVVASYAEAALSAKGVAPDFEYRTSKSDSGAEVLFVHRKLADGSDIYFVNNRENRPLSISAKFGSFGRVPELWDPITGTSTKLNAQPEWGGKQTSVDLVLEPEDAKYVVFRGDVAATFDGKSITLLRGAVERFGLSGAVGHVDLFPVAPPQITLNMPWTVTFQPNRGAPASTMMTTLQPLNENADPGIKYFSGVATYATSFNLPKGAQPGQPLKLDLGQVGDVAEVRVNGQMAGTVWFAPYSVEIGKLVKPGKNTLEVRVANTWVNRLIGDKQPGAQKVTFVTTPMTYKKDAPLRPSGLIGPVQLRRAGR